MSVANGKWNLSCKRVNTVNSVEGMRTQLEVYGM